MGTKKLLEVQKYLLGGKKKLEDLTSDFAINVYYHPSLPLFGTKYSQIESPKSHPIVRECRGLVLHRDTFDVVAKPFNRFFNYCENMIEMEQFNFNDFYCNEKRDGSLAVVYYFNNEWHMNTSGSFGLGEIATGVGKSWREVFWEALDDGGSFGKSKLNIYYTYIFELTSGYNKVVRHYHKPETYLLGITNIEYDCFELSQEYVDQIANEIGLKRPETYNFKSIKEVENWLEDRESNDKTYEGVVIYDGKIRFKVKSKTYLSLSYIKSNGNIFNPKHLLPWILKGEEAELLVYFPELKNKVDEVSKKINNEYNNLKSLWQSTYFISSQKDFALSIVKKTPFSGILFDLRRRLGYNQCEQDLKSAWNSSEDLIIKLLFK